MLRACECIWKRCKFELNWIKMKSLPDLRYIPSALGQKLKYSTSKHRRKATSSWMKPAQYCTTECVIHVQPCWAQNIFQFTANCSRRAASRAHLQSCLLALDLLWCETRAVGRAFCSSGFFFFFFSPASLFDQMRLPRMICTRLKCGQLAQRCAFSFSWEKLSRIHCSSESIERLKTTAKVPHGDWS